MSEKELYEPIKNELDKILGKYYRRHELYITHKKIPKELKNKFDDITYFFLGKNNFPDIMGFVFDEILEKESIVVVEVKSGKPNIGNFYQAKRYAEIFDADHCFLISSGAISEEMRRAFESKNWILKYTKGVEMEIGGETKKWHFPGGVFFSQFDNENKAFLNWFPRDPFEDYKKRLAKIEKKLSEPVRKGYGPGQ